MAVVIIVLLAVGWWSLDKTAPNVVAEIPMFEESSSENCMLTQPQNISGQFVNTSQEVPFFTADTLRWKVCQAGTLHLDARATLIDTYGAYLVVALGTETLWEGEIRDETQSISVKVPHSGWLAIAFVNDAYDPPQDRNLWLSNIEFVPAN